MFMSVVIMVMQNSIGMEKDNDLKRIERVIAENTDIIINRWYELFKTDHENNQ